MPHTFGLTVARKVDSVSKQPSWEIDALVVNQWLEEWNQVHFSEQEHRRKPQPTFYLFKLPALLLWRLSDIYRRRADRPRSQDTATQRAHSRERSEEIGKFVRGGFPWSDLSESQKGSADYQDLRMPGWLPTAIVANILQPGSVRRGLIIDDSEVIHVESVDGNLAKLVLPDAATNRNWRPRVAPLEIIDGQHRLLAFENVDDMDGMFELPVVAFQGLDVTWRAYLFYTINIKPKRINASLAYDLYPLLRVQDWLEKSPDQANVYRETRAQELVEVLWSHPESAWQNRINMLGDSKGGSVTQAAFIRSLMASYVKRWEGRGIGGLFGAPVGDADGDVLQWSRAEQAAFLLLVWQTVADAVRATSEDWAESLRSQPAQPSLPLSPLQIELDSAFASKHSLMATDQGVRGLLQVSNDMCYVTAQDLGLLEPVVEPNGGDGATDEASISFALNEFRNKPVATYLARLATDLCRFDWRTSSFPRLSDEQRQRQMVFKGSSGYRELRRQLLALLMGSTENQVRIAAELVWKRLGY